MSDTPKTDIAWNEGFDPVILSAAQLARRLREQCAALERENAALRAELEAQAVVNGKGSEREAKLLAEVAALRSAMYRVRAAIDDPLGSQAQRLEKAGDLCDEALGKEAQQ